MDTLGFWVTLFALGISVSALVYGPHIQAKTAHRVFIAEQNARQIERLRLLFEDLLKLAAELSLFTQERAKDYSKQGPSDKAPDESATKVAEKILALNARVPTLAFYSSQKKEIEDVNEALRTYTSKALDSLMFLEKVGPGRDKEVQALTNSLGDAHTAFNRSLIVAFDLEYGAMLTKSKP